MRYGSLRDAASGAVLVPTVACAESSWERLRGLLGRPALVTGTGLLLAPCASVHSCGMRYAIDLVYLELVAGGASAADLVPGRQVVFA
jgi:uncharacterized protein